MKVADVLIPEKDYVVRLSDEFPHVKKVEDIRDEDAERIMARLPLGLAGVINGILVVKYKLGDIYELLAVDTKSGVARVFDSENIENKPVITSPVLRGDEELKVMENVGLPLLYTDNGGGFVVISPYSGITVKVTPRGGVGYKRVRVHLVGSRVFIEDGNAKIEVTEELRRLPKVSALGKFYVEGIYKKTA